MIAVDLRQKSAAKKNDWTACFGCRFNSSVQQLHCSPIALEEKLPSSIGLSILFITTQHVHAWVHLVLEVKEWEDVCERGGDQSASIALKSTRHQQFTFSGTQCPDVGPSTLIKMTVWRAGQNNEAGRKIPEQKAAHLDSGFKNTM